MLKSIKVAEYCVDEGNTELENLTKARTIDRGKLIFSQTKISMGLKRKAKLSAEIESLRFLDNRLCYIVLNYIPSFKSLVSY